VLAIASTVVDHENLLKFAHAPVWLVRFVGEWER
jgi:hypothetical protein